MVDPAPPEAPVPPMPPAPGHGSATDADPPGVPNPAGPSGRGTAPVSRPAIRSSERAERMAERLPNWMGSIRFRLTAVYSLVLFGLAALMVLGLYTVLARRLNQERVYVSYTVQPVPGGAVISRNEALDQYRVIEHLANQRS